MNWRDVLSSATRLRPHQTAFSFHSDDSDDGPPDEVSYAALDLNARAIGAYLVAHGLVGRPVVLLFPPGLDYISAFLGCLYAGVIAVPAHPPSRHSRSIDRLVGVVRDSGADTALTTAAGRDRLDRLPAIDGLGPLRLLATDLVAPAAAADWRPPAVGADDVAFLQYTSGSTAAPRGVVLTHANLLANTAMILRSFGLDANVRAVSWLPMYHDMGLIGSVLGTVRCGGTTAMLAPSTFVRDPFRWLKLISAERATVSGGPNFAYDLCVDQVTDEQYRTLDLSSWQVAFNGAEPVRPQTLQRFVDRFAGCGFRAPAVLPCYGLAEASLLVTAGPAGTGFRTSAPPTEANGGGGTRDLVACGAVPPELRLEIVDPDRRRPRPDGVVGEIWLAGASVAVGYWNRVDAVADTFGARLAGTDGPDFLRTGDLGFVRDGQLFVTGRRKDLINIRGRNHYPQDIEQTVEACSTVLVPNGGAAFAVDGADGVEGLAVLHELARNHGVGDLDALAFDIQVRVTERHGVRPHAVVLIRAASLPRTSSGKVSRYAARAAFLDGSLPVLASRIDRSEGEPRAPFPELSDVDHSAIAEFLRAGVAELLSIRPADVSVDCPLSALGLDSLDTVRLQYRVQRWLSVEPAAFDLMSASIAGLAEAIAGQPRTERPDSAADDPAGDDPAGDGPADAPLSHNQGAMWFMHQLAPTSSAYHLSVAAELAGALDVRALRSALAAIVGRHPALRTTFPVGEAGPIQRVHPDLPADVVERDASGWTEQELAAGLAEAAFQPFDLAAGPLLRLVVFRCGANDFRFVFAVHHMVSDLWSLEVLLQELNAQYVAETSGRVVPPPPPVTGYPAAVRSQAARLAGADGERLWAFWQRELAAAPHVLDLPTDNPRPMGPRLRGGLRRFYIGVGVSDRLAALARAEGTTRYTVLLCAFQLLLSRYTGQRDLLVGSPVHGRPRAELSGAVGSFANTAVLRPRLDPNATFRAELRAAAPRVREALRHADLPLALLVEKLRVTREPNRSPLVQALFAWQQLAGEQGGALAGFALGHRAARLRLGELELRPVQMEPPAAQVDLHLTVAEVGGEIGGVLQFDADLFDEDTADRLVSHLRTLLTAIATDPDRPTGQLPLLSPEERNHVLYGWNDTAVDYQPDSHVHDLVAAQAARTPDAPAVTVDDVELTKAPQARAWLGACRTMTYRELELAADRLARYLIRQGVVPEQIVALLLPRGADMLVAMLAVLRAGGAYLPIDPDLPAERVEYLLADSKARLVLTLTDLAATLSPLPVRCVTLDEPRDEATGEETVRLPVRVHPDNLGYVLYTSGSTGRPKGVQIRHRALTNFLTGMRALLQPAVGDRLLAVTTFSFDISALELFLPLMTGGTTHIVSKLLSASGEQLRLRLATGAFSTLQATPATWQLLCDSGWRDASGLTMISGGEALPPALARRLLELDGPLWNMYGPTETTIWSSATRVTEAPRSATPLGTPIANTQIYLLDEALEPVPIGVAGELLIGGDGLARGYLGRPGLTAGKFVPDPYGAVPGSRLFRTGDQATVDAAGRIELLGRLDDQVKVNGHRIELGEIDFLLGLHPLVAKSVTAVHSTGPGGAVLVSYVQPRHRLDGATFDRQQANSVLRDALRQSVPGYMVPAQFVWLDEFPLSASGKVDRRALPPPEPVRAGRREAPTTGTETRLVEILEQLLGVEDLGPTDNLFDHGAHSLLMSRFVVRVNETFGVHLPLRLIFGSPTVEEIAEIVDAADARGADSPITPVDRTALAAAATAASARGVPRVLQAARRLQQSARD